MKTYKCRKHGEVDFYSTVEPKRKSGVVRRCKVCTDAARKVYVTANRTKAVVAIRTWCRSDSGKRSQRKYKDSLRDQTLNAYGNACRCCGETERLFLEVDHVFNDGTAHRKTLTSGSGKFYYWLRENGFPKDRFQLLCSNCNRGKFRNRGLCPHQAGPRLVVGAYRPE